MVIDFFFNFVLLVTLLGVNFFFGEKRRRIKEKKRDAVGEGGSVNAHVASSHINTQIHTLTHSSVEGRTRVNLNVQVGGKNKRSAGVDAVHCDSEQFVRRALQEEALFKESRCSVFGFFSGEGEWRKDIYLLTHARRKKLSLRER